MYDLRNNTPRVIRVQARLRERNHFPAAKEGQLLVTQERRSLNYW